MRPGPFARTGLQRGLDGGSHKQDLTRLPIGSILCEVFGISAVSADASAVTSHGWRDAGSCGADSCRTELGPNSL
jgi:hypothetical protein